MIFEIEQLVYQRSDTFRLKVDHLSVGAGELICIVGPNGSGKTTLLENLSGILLPHHGRVSLLNTPMSPNIALSKSDLGYIPDDDNWFVSELTAHEYLKLLEKVYAKAGCVVNMTRRSRQIARDLNFVLFDQPLLTLSHGNKRKVQIIAGLMHQPKGIIIDELRNGLDPLAVIAAEQIILEEVARGAAIITASHDLWWAERLAQKIVLLHEGAVSCVLRPEELRKTGQTVESVFLATVSVSTGHSK